MRRQATAGFEPVTFLIVSALQAPHPPLADGSIRLREWADDDAPARRRMLDDPECAKWLPGLPQPYTEHHARAAIERLRARQEAGEALDLAIATKDTGAVLGGIQLVLREHGRGEVAYVLARDARGRAIATRALRLLSRWALRSLRLARLEAPIPVDHHAAIRVAARAGFHRDGVLRAYVELHGERVDVAMWSLLRRDC